ncbi:MAG TPA: hypothetical protein VMU17_00900 [Elusimicrobiota bacterium]|nr:hypothetical protein [Elusimicrobiota bacterium]
MMLLRLLLYFPIVLSMAGGEASASAGPFFGLRPAQYPAIGTRAALITQALALRVASEWNPLSPAGQRLRSRFVESTASAVAHDRRSAGVFLLLRAGDDEMLSIPSDASADGTESRPFFRQKRYRNVAINQLRSLLQRPSGQSLRYRIPYDLGRFEDLANIIGSLDPGEFYYIDDGNVYLQRSIIGAHVHIYFGESAVPYRAQGPAWDTLWWPVIESTIAQTLAFFRVTPAQFERRLETHWGYTRRHDPLQKKIFALNVEFGPSPYLETMVKGSIWGADPMTIRIDQSALADALALEEAVRKFIVNLLRLSLNDLNVPVASRDRWKHLRELERRTMPEWLAASLSGGTVENWMKVMATLGADAVQLMRFLRPMLLGLPQNRAHIDISHWRWFRRSLIERAIDRYINWLRKHGGSADGIGVAWPFRPLSSAPAATVARPMAFSA